MEGVQDMPETEGPQMPQPDEQHAQDPETGCNMAGLTQASLDVELPSSVGSAGEEDEVDLEEDKVEDMPDLSKEDMPKLSKEKVKGKPKAKSAQAIASG